MGIKMYNTLSRRKEEFVPIRGAEVKDIGMYVCGPTVYDHVHIGHTRAFVSFDIIRRFIEYRGFKVKFVMNFTDVDDKIINRAREKGIDPLKLSAQFIDEYFIDTKDLNLKKADVNPTPSTHIPEIIHMVNRLVEKGFAYESQGDVYFRISRVEHFGVLSGQSIEDLKVGARIDPGEKKENPMDFALWKGAKPGEISWDSPWGKGRPGWHIECSAMSLRYLGEQFDVHAGGNDLIFPHHENEIVQSEAYSGKHPFVKYWLHNGFVTYNKEKMSKSLGNFFALKDVLKVHEPMTIRFFLANTHYRGPIDYSDGALNEARDAYEKLKNSVLPLQAHARTIEATAKGDPELEKAFPKTKEDFETAMDDDFNTRDAIASLFELSRMVNKAINDRTITADQASKSLAMFKELGENVLGIFPAIFSGKADSKTVDGLVALFIELRQEARKKKDFGTSDKIRDNLKAQGILLEDTKTGTVWKYL